MIKVVRAQHLDACRIQLEFSDGSRGVYDAAPLLQHSGSLLQPLRDPAYFPTFFLELGALCWRNGLELSPAALRQELEAQGLLETGRKAA